MKEILQHENSRFSVFENNIHGNKHFYLRKANAVSVIVVSDYKILLLEHNRMLARGSSFELPGGRIEKGQTALEAAKCELLEETGLEGELESFGEIFPSPSVTDEKVSLFLIKFENIYNLEHTTSAIKEGIKSINFYDYKTIYEMIFSEEINSAVDSFAILKYLMAIRCCG